MNAVLIILFAALLVCAVLIGATHSPKAKGVVEPSHARKLGIYAAVLIALIIIVGLIKKNLA